MIVFNVSVALLIVFDLPSSPAPGFYGKVSVYNEKLLLNRVLPWQRY